jgi:triacylglycerol esterase/lipase EstA (alpha/beta hydrolase family)
MNTINRTRLFLVLIFCSIAAGANAQCDSLKDGTVAYKIKISDFNPNYKLGVSIAPAPDLNEVRRIYFIHGLAGDATAWEKVAEACEIGAPGFPARKCGTIRVDYTKSTGSLYLAASEVRTDISDRAAIDRIYGLYPGRAILIAHSQGGMVARELMHLDMVKDSNHFTLINGMNYGGVITVASPLQGAMILNNRGMLIDMANNGCKRLLSAPALAIASDFQLNIQLAGGMIPLRGMVDKIKMTLFKILGNVVESVCDVATNALPTIFLQQYYDGITDSYTVGASTIDTLNQDTNNANYRAFPKMAFYAVEPQENIMWRTLNGIVNNPNKAEAFEANDDWQLFDNTVKPMIDDYQAKYVSYNTYAVMCNGWKKAASCVIALNVSAAYYSGLEWFNNANASWQVITGAAVKNGNTVTLKTENDGVVLAESAANLPYATHKSMEIYPNKNSTVDVDKGSSHMQVRNDAGLKEHLNILFNGKYDPWFKVEKH